MGYHGFIDRNFGSYIYMAEVNTALAPGRFQNGGDIMPTLDFWMQLLIQLMETIIKTETADSVSPMWACIRPQIVESYVKKVTDYRGKCGNAIVFRQFF